MYILYRIFPFAIAFPVAAGIMTLLPTEQAYAQADLNIQSRIDAVAAPFQVQPIPVAPSSQPARPDTERRPAPVTRVVESPACLADKHRCLADEEVDALFIKHVKEPHLLTTTPGGTDVLTELKSSATSLDRKYEIIKTLALPINIKPGKKRIQAIGPPNIKPGTGEDSAPTQPTTVKFSFPSGPTYESNATKSNTAARSDSSVSFGGGFQFTTQGFRNLDVIGISAGTSLVRYARLADKSFDTLTGSAQYQLFLGAYDVTAKMLDLSRGSNLPTGQVTFNTLTFGLQNSTAFSPIFHTETVSLTTPTVVYSWQNIPFDGNLCATRLNPKLASFCHYADVSIAVGHTLADNRLLENTNLAASATLGNRIGGTDFVASLGTTITGRTYDNVVGGRNDLMLQIGPKLQYTPLSNVTTSIAVSYNRNYSSLATAQWHGWIVQSGLTLSF